VIPDDEMLGKLYDDEGNGDVGNVGSLFKGLPEAFMVNGGVG
jgi:hypothetical protein